MTTEVKCPELPDIRLVSGSQWIDAHAPGASPITESFRVPLPIATETYIRLAAGSRVTTTEVCGFIDSRFRLHYVSNVHAEPERNFMMDQNEVRRVIERVSVANERIIGVFHTHPGGSRLPSANDIAGWPNRDLGWRYFIGTPDGVFEYEYVNQPAHPKHMAGVPTQR